jgi:hypothetical protein
MQPDIENEKNITQKTREKIPAVYFIIVLVLALVIFALVVVSKKTGNPSLKSQTPASQTTFTEDFQKKETINETAKISESTSSDWWVNSGGLMATGGGIGETIQGDLSADSEWFGKYKKSNPKDTDEGAHPQNIFRLVARGNWDNLRQEAYFRINKINLSESLNRNESNGILLFNRYEDGDNLYYTGLRVDGSAIIKKKYGGTYYTLSEKKIFSGEKYDREKNPNLIPLGEWIGLRSEFRNTPDGDVEIKLYVDEGKTGNWKLASSVVDDGRKEFGKHILSDPGHAGIRTDFMDVEFTGYKIEELK